MENRKKGIIYILLSSLFFALMASFVKSVAHIPLAEKIFFRNLVGIVSMLWLIKRNKVINLNPITSNSLPYGHYSDFQALHVTSTPLQT